MQFTQEPTKCCLFFFNLIFAAIGIVLVVESSFTFSDLTQAQEYIPFQIGRFCAVLLILTGPALLFVSFLGCYVTVNDIKSMIPLYTLILLIVAIVQVLGLILFCSLREKAQNHTVDILREGLEKYRVDAGIRHRVDYLHSHLHCCGLNSSSDWSGEYGTIGYPPSCCESPIPIPDRVIFPRPFPLVGQDEGARSKGIFVTTPNTEMYCQHVEYTKSCREAINEFLYAKQNIFISTCKISAVLILTLLGIRGFVVFRMRHGYYYY